MARRLLGKVLVVRAEDGAAAGEIVEVEAYLGEADPASHAYRGLRPRNRSMFASGGTCYVYLSYGVNHCMNVVTGPAGIGQAVLLRALTPVVGVARMEERRGGAKGIANGPGKLTQALGIGLEFDGRDFFGDDLKIVDPGRRLPRGAIATSPRIGISKAADLPLRFYLWSSPDISRPHRPE